MSFYQTYTLSSHQWYVIRRVQIHPSDKFSSHLWVFMKMMIFHHLSIFICRSKIYHTDNLLLLLQLGLSLPKNTILSKFAPNLLHKIDVPPSKRLSNRGKRYYPQLWHNTCQYYIQWRTPAILVSWTWTHTIVSASPGHLHLNCNTT